MITQTGWDPLPGAIRDVKDVARALKDNGFNVTLKTNLTRNTFNRTFADFFYRYGRKKTNRLLFYYAGHGFTQRMFTGEDQGYLVMVDAPAPEKDLVGFEVASIDMQVVVTQAKKTKARHVLFMFDSCFSGAILNLRERVVPEAISDSVSLPVRQFITAGRANEPVPDHSIFKQAFLDLLEGRDKEPIPDGYITGEELGLYLKNKVPEYSPNQHPQYGKIKDIRLDKGDFVFALKIPFTTKPPAPVKLGGIRDYDKIVEERKANKKKWGIWQKRLEKDFAKVRRDNTSRDLGFQEKAEAWEGLLKSYSADNPYTTKDDELRSEAAKWEKFHRMVGEGNWDKVEELGLKLMGSMSSLSVNTVPDNARIRILNIVPKFYQGMELDSGRYHVEVSASGYKTEKRWLELSAGENKDITIRLERIQPKKAQAMVETKETYIGIIKTTSEMIELDPEDSKSYINRGEAYYSLNKYAKAIQDFDKAIELDPKNAWAYHRRGNAYAGLNQNVKAIQDYDKAIDLNPKNPWAYFNRGGSYYSLYQNVKAMELDPKNTGFYYGHLGVAYAGLNQYVKAVQNFDKATDLDPEQGWFYYERGNAYLKLQQYVKAIQDYDRAIELGHNSSITYSDRGLAYSRLNQYVKAIQDYDRAITLDPKDAWAHAARGDTYSRLDQEIKAIHDYDKAIELDPKYAWVYKKRGFSHFILNKTKQGCDDMNRACDLGDCDGLKAAVNDGICH